MQDFDWKILVSLYNTKNITKSASLLYISQPALTKRLHAIENELGCTLVTRTRNGLDFTMEGEQIVRKAKKILTVIDEVHQDIAQFKNGTTGCLALGVPYSYVRFVLPSLLKKFTARYPDVMVHIMTALSDKLVHQVQDGHLDLCFSRYTFEDNSLNKYLISVDQIYAVYNQPFTLKDLPHLPYIEYSKNSVTNSTGRLWWSENFDAPQKLRFRVPNGDTYMSMIQQGLGYGIFYDRNYFEHDKSIYAIPLTLKNGDDFTRKTWMVSQKDTTNPCAENFIRLVKETLLENKHL